MSNESELFGAAGSIKNAKKNINRSYLDIDFKYFSKYYFLKQTDFEMSLVKSNNHSFGSVP